MDTQPIVVVGAGPVGLTVAFLLARHGLPVRVLEAGPTPSPEWRASTFHPPTLELYDSVGIAQEMVSSGLVAQFYQLRDRHDGAFAQFDLSVLSGDTPFPYRLQYEQYKLVELLQTRLNAMPNAEILFGHRLEALEQTRNQVTLKVAADDLLKTMTTPYLLAADGAKSTVRKLLGLAFTGLTYENSYLLLSTQFPFEEHLPDICYVNYIADPDEHMMLLRIPDCWRVLFSVKSGEEELALTEEDGRRRLAKVVAGSEEIPVIQRQLYRVHQRVADTFNVNRTFLVGDAAHINSPFGGMGLNSGIHDAFDISSRILRVLDGADAETEFNSYSRIRRTIATDDVHAQTDRNTRNLAEKDPALRKANQSHMARVAADPILSREWLLDATMIRSRMTLGIGVDA